MKGTVEQLPSGSWRITVMVEGVRHRRTVRARTKTEARRALAELITEVGATRADGWTATVAHLLRVHSARSTWSATTRSLADYLTSRIPQWFLDLRVGDVRAPELYRLWDELGREVGPHQASRVHDLLGAAWQRAIRMDWIVSNPLTAVRPPVPPRSVISPPSPADVRRAFEAITVDWHHTLFTLAATTGARRGELCGLQWGDIECTPTGGQIRISRSVAYTPTAGVVVKGTKTGALGERTVAIDAHTSRLLVDRRERMVGRCAELHLELAPAMFVFPADCDPRLPCRPDNLTQAWARITQRAGVSIRLHDLRHFAATQLLANGVDVRTVAGRLGHARASTTLDRYAAFIPANDQAAADLLGRLVS